MRCYQWEGWLHTLPVAGSWEENIHESIHVQVSQAVWIQRWKPMSTCLFHKVKLNIFLCKETHSLQLNLKCLLCTYLYLRGRLFFCFPLSFLFLLKDFFLFMCVFSSLNCFTSKLMCLRNYYSEEYHKPKVSSVKDSVQINILRYFENLLHFILKIVTMTYVETKRVWAEVLAFGGLELLSKQ